MLCYCRIAATGSQPRGTRLQKALMPRPPLLSLPWQKQNIFQFFCFLLFSAHFSILFIILLSRGRCMRTSTGYFKFNVESTSADNERKMELYWNLELLIYIFLIKLSHIKLPVFRAGKSEKKICLSKTAIALFYF